MKRFKRILFIIFFLLYAIGICIGCIKQISSSNQQDMYTYLNSAISGYNTSLTESIKSVLTSNLRLFVFLVAGGIFLIGPVVIAGIVLMEGYSAGFAVISVLRLFGLKGFLYCIANLVSVAVIIPVICWYACSATANIIKNRNDRRQFLKTLVFLIAILFPVILADGILRGLFSSIIMKFMGGG